MTLHTRVTPRECAAIRLLSYDWTVRELSMCFGYGDDVIINHSNGECSCEIDELELESILFTLSR